MGDGQRPSIGDRLEAAFEHRADLDAEIERGEAQRPSRRKLVTTIAWLAVTGISLYLAAPALLETLASWRDLQELAPAWYLVMAGLQVASMTSLWWLQR